MSGFRTLVAACCCGLAYSSASGQTPGVSPGFRLLGPGTGTDTHLVDTNGAIVHTWPGSHLPGAAAYLLQDGALLRSIKTGTLNLGGAGGGVQRVAHDGTVHWDFRYDSGGVTSHHDLAELPNGNVLMIAWEDKTVAEAVSAGRNPTLISGSVFRPDHVIEVHPTGPASGAIVWQWHVWDHLVQDFDPARANFGVVGSHPELVDINYPPVASTANDWNHTNAVAYDPVHDWIILTTPHQNEFWVIDHGTTTAEAAGHTGGRWGRGGDLLYRWGNPQAWRAGTASAQQLFFPHAAHIIPEGRPGAGHALVFNNQAPGGSSVVELVLPLDPAGNFVLLPGGAYGPVAPTWSYAASGFQSALISNAERLPNGNTLICSGLQQRVFEVTPAGQQLWNWQLSGTSWVFHAHHVERRLWARGASVPLSRGGSVGFDLLAGTPFAGAAYVLLASASGTSPGTPVGAHLLQLNYDPWTEFSLTFANSPFMSNTLGFLGAVGEGTCSLNLPPRFAPPAAVGTAFDLAFVMVEWATATPVGTSNAVRMTILP